MVLLNATIGLSWRWQDACWREWVEAINTTIYILNQSYTKDLKWKKPHEAYIGKKPFVSHFKIFGCDCYVYVPNNERNKLQPKSTKCILLGYSDDKNAYKLYEPTTKTIVSSHDMVFKEEQHVVEDEKKSSTLSSSDEVAYYELGPSVIPTLKEEEESSDDEIARHQPAVTQ